MVLDNTWATPLGFRAFDHGVDVSVHAATKYIGGHSDVLLGVIVCSEATFPPMHRLWTDMGVTASSDDCFLGLRGLRTLAARMARHQASALRSRAGCAMRPEVREVLYPALAGARGHDLWKRDFTAASGLFGVVLQPVAHERVAAMLDASAVRDGMELGRLREPDHPDVSRAHAHGDAWNAGGPCLRLAVGLDDPHDLIADLSEGFVRLKAVICVVRRGHGSVESWITAMAVGPKMCRRSVALDGLCPFDDHRQRAILSRSFLCRYPSGSGRGPTDPPGAIQASR